MFYKKGRLSVDLEGPEIIGTMFLECSVNVNTHSGKYKFFRIFMRLIQCDLIARLFCTEGTLPGDSAGLKTPGTMFLECSVNGNTHIAKYEFFRVFVRST